MGVSARNLDGAVVSYAMPAELRLGRTHQRKIKLTRKQISDTKGLLSSQFNGASQEKR